MALVSRALGINVRLYRVSNGLRNIIDAFRFGYATGSGLSEVTVDLRPAAGADPAQSNETAVTTFYMMRSSQPVEVTITRTPAVGSAVTTTQAISNLLMITPALETGETMSVTVTHSNLINTAITVVSA